MPRIAGVSAWVTCWRIRRSPRGLTVPSCLGLRPMILFTRVILSFLSGTARLLRQVAAGAPPPRRVQVLQPLDPPQRVDGSLEHVVGIVRPQRLGQDVLHP